MTLAEFLVHTKKETIDTRIVLINPKDDSAPAILLTSEMVEVIEVEIGDKTEKVVSISVDALIQKEE